MARRKSNKYLSVDEYQEATNPKEEKSSVKPKIKPKTKNQEEYVKAIYNNTIIMCAGKSGTGKSLLAINTAVEMLNSGKVKHIVLTRPLVECDEKLGYLPGEMNEKVLPFLLPLIEYLCQILDPKTVQRYQQEGIIKILPLAYLRGYSIKESVIILDEAQNCTFKQLKLFLTRIGDNSKMIMIGDFDQSDLIKTDRKEENPFQYVMGKLADIEGIAIAHLEGEDILRHPLIVKILERI